MRALLPQLAPRRLPPILRGLEGLGNEALIAPLLFAPDAPLVPGALPLLNADVVVRHLVDDLYQTRAEAFGGAGTIVFGLIGDRFVVATDLFWARMAAELEVSDVDDAEGAAVGRTDFSTWSSDRIAEVTGFRPRPRARGRAADRDPGRLGLDAGAELAPLLSGAPGVDHGGVELAAGA